MQLGWTHYNFLGQMGGICFPSFLPHWKMSQEGRRRQGISGTCGSSVEVSAVVSGITRTASGFSPDTPKEPHVVDSPVQQPKPLIAAGQLQLAT